MSVKSHKFRGRVWRVVASDNPLAENDGTCDAPTSANKTLAYYTGLRGPKLLESLIHEGLHACIWDLSEEAVEESAKDLARLLWRLGFRRTKKTED